jgi:hypothetical protein
VPSPEHEKGVPSSASTLTLNPRNTPTHSVSALNLNSNAKKLTLTVTSSNSDYTVTTAALSDWTVAGNVLYLLLFEFSLKIHNEVLCFDYNLVISFCVVLCFVNI